MVKKQEIHIASFEEDIAPLLGEWRYQFLVQN